MKQLLLLLLFFFSFLDAATIVGNWVFDFKYSVAMKSQFRSIYSQLEGMQIQVLPDGRYSIVGHGAGSWRKQGNNFILFANNGKKMGATLLKNSRLQILQHTQAGDVPLFFHKKEPKRYYIGNYLYLNRVYKQKQKVYDNGYLYYLFLGDGTFYSYATPKTEVTAEEIKKRGDRLKYRFLGDKIVMKGPFKVIIKAYKKQKIVTSQGDTLYLQQ